MSADKKVRAQCVASLGSIINDDDVLDYIVGTVQGDETDEEKLEAVSGFLLSCEAVADEAEAEAKVTALLAALAVGGASASAPVDVSDAVLQKLSAGPQKMAEMNSGDSAAKDFADKDETLGGRLVSMDEALSDRKKRKKRLEEERKASKRLHERVRAQREAEEEALRSARVEAVRLRATKGAYLGAIEARPFQLPNPGGGPDLLSDASFTLTRGKRYGLIGRNGKGKSTLLKAVASRQVGEIPAALTVHYVTQEVQLDEETEELTPLQMIVAADVERTMLLDEKAALLGKEGGAEECSDPERLQAVVERLEQISAGTAEARALSLLVGLGFSPELRERPMRALSGGWRVRTALAAAIFARPDMLLLDEPTNHLSIGAVLWLARELTTSSVWAERIVMIVSHDRVFLDEVCTDVLHISGAARRLTQSHGNYSMWAKRRATQQKTFERTAAVRAAEIEKLKEFAGHGYRYGGSSSAINKMKMKEKQAEKLEEEAGAEEEALAALQEDAELPLTLKAGGELSGFAVQLRDVGFGYDAKRPPLFTGAELGIDSKSRVVLLGENGLGKTTLVKLMLGTLEPSSGEVHRAGQARVGLVNQHHADQLDLTLTPLQFLMDKFPGDGSYAHEQALRSHLHGAGVLSEHQVLPASALSGGQRSRVALAAVSYAAPHVLILDEPTNNLDLESVAALADCVERFEGGVVLVGHDQYFVGRVAKEVWAVEDGRLRKQGSFEAYRKVQLAKIHAEQP